MIPNDENFETVFSPSRTDLKKIKKLAIYPDYNDNTLGSKIKLLSLNLRQSSPLWTQLAVYYTAGNTQLSTVVLYFNCFTFYEL